MNFLERLLNASPWWSTPDWEKWDLSLKAARSSGFVYRHLAREECAPSNMPQGSISIIRGPRQVGKTTELKFLVTDLISYGVSPRNIAYCPCDDIIHFRELMSLVKAFAETCEGPGYLFLDEITSVKNWPRAVKTLADAGVFENIYLLLTGSSGAVHLIRPLANSWASLGYVDDLYYWPSRKGKEVDFVYYPNQGKQPFGVEVKYQGRISGWDEQSITKEIGRGILVTRDSFEWGDVCQIPLWAFLTLS